LVLLLHHEPLLGPDEAGQRVGLFGCQVRRWRQRWAAGAFSVQDLPGRGRKAVFFPLDTAVVKALACEAVWRIELPLRRQALADLTTYAQGALGKSISRSTLWQILHGDAL
jgi:hypothetical protein